MGGYNIQLNNPLIVLKPSVFLLTDTKNYHLDVTARMEYNKMFNGGIYLEDERIGRYLAGSKHRKIQHRIFFRLSDNGHTECIMGEP